MRRLNLFLACCLFALPAVAQSPQPAPVPPPNPAPAPAPVPVVPVPKPMPVASVKVPAGPLYAGDLVVLDGSDSVGDSIDWEIISPPDVTTYVTDSNGKTVAFSNKTPGTYVFRIEAESVIGGKIAKSKKRVSFTTLDPTPPAPAPTPVPVPVNPPTPPVPPPAPSPAAFTGHVHATLVFDVDEPSTAQLRASPVKADLAALNASWYVAPTAGPVARLFSAYTTTDGLPTLYFTDDAGKMVGTPLKAPTTEAQVIAKLKTIRGTN